MSHIKVVLAISILASSLAFRASAEANRPDGFFLGTEVLMDAAGLAMYQGTGSWLVDLETGFNISPRFRASLGLIIKTPSEIPLSAVALVTVDYAILKNWYGGICALTMPNYPWDCGFHWDLANQLRLCWSSLLARRNNLVSLHHRQAFCPATNT